MKDKIIANLLHLRGVFQASKEFAEIKLKRLGNEDLSGNTNISIDHSQYTNQLNSANSKIIKLDECIDWLNKQA